MTDLPDVKLKGLVQFPVSVTGRTAIAIEKTNGRYYLDLDVSELVQNTNISEEEVDQSWMIIWNSTTDSYELVPYSLAATAGVASLDGKTGALDIGDGLTFTGDTLEVTTGLKSVRYDTRADAIAATDIPATAEVIYLNGRNDPGDLGGGAYVLIDEPAEERSWHFENTAAGTWWQLNETTVNPRMFGALGDDVDDTEAFEDCSEYLIEVFGGGRVEGIPGDEYRLVVTAANENLGIVWNGNVYYDGRGATLNLDCTGNVYGNRLLGNNFKITGWNFRCPDSNGIASTQSIWHALITLGCAYGDGGTPSDPSEFASPSDIEIWGNTFDSEMSNGLGAMICGYGGGDNIHIHDNEFLANDNICSAIGFDWLPIGDIDESDLAATVVAYGLGDAATLHWTNIRIHDNKFGSLSLAPTLSGGSPVFGSHGIRLSGVISFDISNNDFYGTTYAGVFITGGDLAAEFAQSAVLRYMFGRNWRVANNTFRNSNDGHDIAMDCHPDNIYQAATNPANPQYPYSGIYLTVYPTNAVIENNFGNGSGASGAIEGIKLGYMIGGTVRGNVSQFHKYGILVGDEAKNIKIIDGNTIQQNLQAGIYVQGSSVPPQSILISGNEIHQNCTSGAGVAGNVCIDAAEHCAVFNNDIGRGDSTADGINNTGNAVGTKIADNRIWAIKNAGDGLKLSAPITTVSEVYNNKMPASGTFTAVTGLEIVAIRRKNSTANASGFITIYSAKSTSISAGAPTFGTYVTGDEMHIESVASGAVTAIQCTSGGTPGTWKNATTLS